MIPIKWKNTYCNTEGNEVVGKTPCTPYECETPVSSHEDIIDLLDNGWPICPDCGNDMDPMEN